MGQACIRGVEDLDPDDRLPHPFGRCLRDIGNDDDPDGIIDIPIHRHERTSIDSARPRTLLNSNISRGKVEKCVADDPASPLAQSSYFESIKQQAESIAKQYAEATDEREYTGGELIRVRKNSSASAASAKSVPSPLPLSAPAELVLLHVYDLGTSSSVKMVNHMLRPLGTGVYHCGIELFGYEWSFSDTTTGKGDGVFCSKPKQCRGYSYSETVQMGYCNCTAEAVMSLIETMAEEWPVESYNLLNHNCGHFCSDLCFRLGVGPLPDWVTSLAAAGASAKNSVCCSSASATGNPVEEIPMVEILPTIPSIYAGGSNSYYRNSSVDSEFAHCD